MSQETHCVIEPWGGLFVAAHVTELVGGCYAYAKLYSSAPRDAWSPDALMKLGSPAFPCPVEALDVALERAFAVIHDMHRGRMPELRWKVMSRAAAGACV